MRRPGKSRRNARGLTALELAIAVSIAGCTLAAIVPACVHTVRTARTAEAVDNVDKILGASIRARNDKPTLTLVSAPLTPPVVPRGEPSTDPPATWDHETWRALEFSLDEPHWYSYQLDVDADPATPLRVIAHGDLDGDGVLSTFERTAAREGATLVARPGLIVTADLE